MTRLGLIIAALVLVLDQLSKWAIMAMMRPPGVAETPFYADTSVELLPVLDIVVTWNRGVSFGVFNNDGPYNAILLTVLGLVISAVLVLWLRKTHQRHMAVGLGMIIGGAIGNVVDRVRFGAVFDFIYFHVGSFQWPAFNVADSGITLGAVVLFLDALSGARDSRRNSA